jgi:hypothetical protein
MNSIRVANAAVISGPQSPQDLRPGTKIRSVYRQARQQQPTSISPVPDDGRERLHFVFCERLGLKMTRINEYF